MDQTSLVFVFIVNDPRRFNYAAQSFKADWLYQAIWKETSEVGEPLILAGLYGRAAEKCNKPWLLLCLGDFEVPSLFIREALKSGADIYGVAFYDQKIKKYIAGQKRGGTQIEHVPFPSEDVYPDNCVLVKASLAKEFVWTDKCSFPSRDHLYPFMEWADKVKHAKIVVDKSLVGVHHKD